MIELVVNHVLDAIGKLVQQFKGKPKIEAFLSAFIEQIQELEEVFYQLATERGIDGEGAQLDGLGSIVGEARQGRSDVLYRAAILKRIGINISAATTEDVLEIMTLFDPDTYELIEYQPATFWVRKASGTTNPLEFLALLQGIKSSGVKVGFQYAEVDEDNVFSFASGDVEETSTTQGFADDAETTGGYWSDVVE